METNLEWSDHSIIPQHKTLKYLIELEKFQNNQNIKSIIQNIQLNF